LIDSEPSCDIKGKFATRDMAGKAIDNSASGALILIIPIALAIVLLFKVWPVLLALVILGGSVSIWQRYQWQKWSRQLDPIFHQLIQENRGCLTVLDLSMKANLSGTAAKRYLDAKAEEFGAQVRDWEDKGRVYYFITANTLGSIFDDSTPNFLLESEPYTAEVQESYSVPPLLWEKPIESPTQADQPAPAPLTQEKPPEPLTQEKPPEPLTQEEPPEPLTQEEPPEPLIEEEEPPEPLTSEELAQPIPKKHRILQSLIQSELARRLDVHSSTVLKRRDDSDFPEWSRSRDPEGIAWEYSSDTREFYPMENQ